MFGATVLVPIIVQSYGLPLSIQTTLLFAGLGTLFFHACTKFKVPAFLGSSFAFLGGFAAVANLNSGKYAGMTGAEKLPYALGGIVVAGCMYLVLAALFKVVGPYKVMRYFPPVVTGPIIILIGLILAPSAVTNASTCWWLAILAITIIIVCNIWGRGMNLNLLFGGLRLPAHIPALHLLMPLGISFYTLSAVSYLVDVSRGACEAQRNYGKLLLFLMFFPVITEGPISRYGQLGTQLEEGHRFDYRRFCFGIQLIVWGFFKSVVMANRLSAVVGNIFSTYSSHSGSVVILTVMLMGWVPAAAPRSAARRENGGTAGRRS